MIITLDTDEYDPRRWSRPWIAAVVAWRASDGRMPALRWGSYIGRDGDAGIVTIEAEPLDIIRSGHRCYQCPEQSDNDWWLVMSDGSLMATDPVSAYMHWCDRLQSHSQVDAPIASPDTGNDLATLFRRRTW